MRSYRYYMFLSTEKQNHTKAAVWVYTDEVPGVVRLMNVENRRVAARVGVVLRNKELVLAWEDEDLLRIADSNSIVGLYSMPPR